MLSTAIIIFREVLEIALILSVMLAATHELPGRLVWISAGFGGGIAGAGVVAFFAGAISGMASGMGQELFNAIILFTAALFIGWTVLWMRKHARAMAAHFKKVGQDVTDGHLPLYTLSLVVGLAVLREGSEIVLFVYGMLAAGQSAGSILSGSLAGLAVGAATGIALYYGLLKIPTRHMLKYTSWLLMLLVAGLTAHGAAYLSAAGYFDGLSEPLWDTSWLLSEEGIIGAALHSLIGYSAQPSAVQIIFYSLTLSGLLLATLVIDKRQAARK